MSSKSSSAFSSRFCCCCCGVHSEDSTKLQTNKNNTTEDKGKRDSAGSCNPRATSELPNPDKILECMVPPADSTLYQAFSFATEPLVHISTDSPPVSNVLNQLYSWTDFDVFELDRATDGNPLYVVAKAIFEAEGLLDNWKLDKVRVENFLAAAQAGYRKENPYHNSVHAADVTQATYVMLRHSMQAGVQFTKLETFSLILAAVVHDLAHPGLTNDFLANTRHKTALVYNDKSINENYHVSCAFRLAEVDTFNIFSNLTNAEYKEVRRIVIGCVLMTDMTQHFDLLERFVKGRQKEPDLNKWESKDCLLQLLLHTADISNPFRVVKFGTLWGELVCSEFLQQGDKEKELGLCVTPTCDKKTVVVSTSQLRFAKWFVKPLMEEFRYISKEFSALSLELLSRTEQYWSVHEKAVQEGNAHPQKREWYNGVNPPPF